MKQVMISTSDNPFNPFDKFDEWHAYDLTNHYYSCELLARFAQTSNELSEADNMNEIERAIDLIINSKDLNVTGIEGVSYIKLTSES